MKKIICSIFMAMVMLASFSTCFADPALSTVRDEEQVSPRFVVTFSHSEGLLIDSKGYATMAAYLRPKASGLIDKVEVTLRLEKIDGTLLRKKTSDAKWSEVAFEFQVEDNKQLIDKGAYYIDVTYKCYKDGKLLETLRGSAADTY